MVLHHLNEALVYTEASNVDTNRKLWTRYAQQYFEPSLAFPSPSSSSPHPSDWVQRMAQQVGRSPADLRFIGDEWSDAASLDSSLSAFLYPLLAPTSTVAEIGVGGGRVASRVASRVAHLACFDISEAMLSAAREALAPHASTCAFHLLTSPSSFPASLHHTFDVVYAFDVLPHVDLHTQRDYFRSLHLLLKPGREGRVFLSVATITTPLGWERFSRQRGYTAGGFYFTSPDTVRALAHHSGWSIIQHSTPDPQSTNVYINRDFLFVMQPQI